MIKKCEHCQKQFETCTTQKYCSIECHKEQRKYKKEIKKLDEASYTHTICVNCNCNFAYLKRNDRKPRIFCSRSCASKHYIKNGIFDKWRLRTQPLKPRVDVLCTICQKSYKVTEREFFNHIKHDMKFCCSKKCRYKYTSQLFTGKIGHAFTDEMKKHQKETMLKRHGVTNAFLLAKHRTKSKPQIKIFEWIKSNFQDYEFEIEKLVTTIDNKKFYADIISFKRKIIIEFYGDFWHCNPLIYKDENIVHPKKLQTIKEIRNFDLQRQQNLENLGYTIYIIWENEYINTNWKETISNFLNLNEK